MQGGDVRDAASSMRTGRERRGQRSSVVTERTNDTQLREGGEEDRVPEGAEPDAQRALGAAESEPVTPIARRIRKVLIESVVGSGLREARGARQRWRPAAGSRRASLIPLGCSRIRMRNTRIHRRWIQARPIRRPGARSCGHGIVDLKDEALGARRQRRQTRGRRR